MSAEGNGSAENGGGSFVGKLVFWVIVAVAAVIVLRLVFAAVGLAVFVAFRLLPIVLVGWILYKAWKWIAGRPASSE